MFHHLQKQQRAFVLCWNKFCWFKKTRFYNWKIRDSGYL
jgi:hypothetical protein